VSKTADVLAELDKAQADFLVIRLACQTVQGKPPPTKENREAYGPARDKVEALKAALR